MNRHLRKIESDSKVLTLLNVSFHYPNRQGIERISFSVSTGEFILLAGQTGSGKTTLFRVISLELLPDTGEIILAHLKSSRLKRKQLPEWRRQSGIIYQDLRLLNDRNLIENVKLVAHCEKRLKDSPKARALRVLHKVGLADKLKRLPEQISLGEQQRVTIARALVNEPFLLLADEPVSNLDVETSDQIADLLYKISLSGTALIVATHQPERFLKYKPRIIRINKGRLVES